jgi:hypothetical protein
MIQFRAAVVMSLLLVGACLDVDRARAQSLIAAPGTSGDQLLFFYDATAGRVPFRVVSNLAPVELTLEIAWYTQNLSLRLATQMQTLAPGANVILDPSQVSGVGGNAGLTVVTPVMSTTDPRPVVPPPLSDTLASAPSGALAGGFTLADLSANSAFGQNPLARLAVDADGRRAVGGSIVHGTAIRYQRIAPEALIVPFYFNPASPDFTNRVILGAFEDRYGATGFSIGPVGVDLGFALIDDQGVRVRKVRRLRSQVHRAPDRIRRIAVVVHPDNDWVDTLTVEELRRLWEPEAQGKVKRWSDIRAGWPNVPIHLFGPGEPSYWSEAPTDPTVREVNCQDAIGSETPRGEPSRSSSRAATHGTHVEP